MRATLPDERATRSPSRRHTAILDERGTVVDAMVLDDRPAPGTVLDGRYRIGGLLGQGGMGYVLAAEHVVLGKRLAIKVLRDEMTSDPEIAGLFREEARTVSALGHPNIVDVSDFGTLPPRGDEPGASYFVMERLEGRSLADVLSSEGALEVRRAVHIVRQIAQALHAVHERGVVHRDVKPENVFLTTRAGQADHVKVLDFGLAMLGANDTRVIGTPHYMSPEQARGRGIDRRSDIYSLGVVLFELVAGTLPFDAVEPLVLLRKHALDAPPSLRERRPDVPDAVCAAVDAALAKRADARPPTMDAWLTMLDSVEPPAPPPASREAAVSPVPAPVVMPGLEPPRSGASFSRPRVSTPSRSPAPAAPSARPPIALAATMILAMFALVGAALVASWRSPPPAPTATLRADLEAATAPSAVAAQAEPRAPDPPPAAPPVPRPAVDDDRAPPRPIPPRGMPSPAVSPEDADGPLPTTAPTEAPETNATMRPFSYADQNLLDPWQ